MFVIEMCETVPTSVIIHYHYVCLYIYTAKLHLVPISLIDHLVNKAILCVYPISDPINDISLLYYHVSKQIKEVLNCMHIIIMYINVRVQYNYYKQYLFGGFQLFCIV